ncbi:MAG TPA: 16S rRNA (cytidine(1402)-2'-O)-methyltransferase [Candidatus Moranbacteria bacterium]|nr:16S rRNA (cytidine(1402)-2'-O)-methyltransferase [Candidatus Moranbacteria bacterium]
MINGILYIVATPIGNLEDITLRALRILKEVDLVVCEDTRVTSKLLSHYNISKPLLSLHQHSKETQFEKIIFQIKDGKSVAYVSDAGTPGISDPGNQLVAAAAKENIVAVPIPGASALGALVSVSGIDMQQFVFMGFPPHKKGRETFFKKIAAAEHPTVYYDSPHRVLKNIELLEKLGSGKKIIIGRELTKIFEEIVRGDIPEIKKYFQGHPEKMKGEFAIIVHCA